MAPDFRKKLRELVARHEGFRQFPYRDINDFLTVGFGRNLDTVGIMVDEAYQLLDNDLDYHLTSLNQKLNFFNELDDSRKCVLIDMSVNLGINKLFEFVNFITALDSGDYDKAAEEMLESKWAKQVPNRANELANIMRTGKL